MRVTDLLRTMDIFENLQEEEIEAIARMLRERRLKAGDILTGEGEQGDSMFLVTGGRIRLYSGEGENEKNLAYFGDGDFFGEMSLITGAPRSATAVADTESRVLVLQKQEFEELLSSNSSVMREMLRVISRRTVQTNQQLIQDDGVGQATATGGKVFAVFSPRGGAGKTTIAVNAAIALARDLPERSALLDLNLVFGHAAALLGIAPLTSLASLAAEDLRDFDRRQLADYLVVHSSTLQVAIGSLRPEEGESVSGSHVKAVLAAMRRQFVATFVDCGSNFDDPTLEALESADRVIMVCTPELSTLRDVAECQRIFGDRLHMDRAKIYYLLNHNQPFDALTREQFESHLERTMSNDVPHAGDAAMKAIMKGVPMAMGGTSLFMKALARMNSELVPEEVRMHLRGATGKVSRVPVAVGGGASGNGTQARPKGLRALFRRA